MESVELAVGLARKPWMASRQTLSADYARHNRTTVKALIVAVMFSLGLAACSKSDVGPNTSTTTTASAQLNWDQGNWNQSNWQ